MTDLNRVGTPVPTPVDPRAVSIMSSDLSKLDDLWNRLDIAVLTPPAPGSPASKERQDELEAYAHDQASIAMRAALDHLRAWRNLLNGGELPTYAHLSLLRTAHEAALIAYWLVEPNIGAATRLTRGIAAQAADYEERRKFENSIGMTVATPPGKLAIDRLSILLMKANNRGLAKKNKKGILVLNVTLPATSELFNLYEHAQVGSKAEFLYRLYSGYAHAKQWALTAFAQQQAPYDSFGRTVALSQSSDLLAVAATQRVVNAVDRALAAYEQLRVVTP